MKVWTIWNPFGDKWCVMCANECGTNVRMWMRDKGADRWYACPHCDMAYEQFGGNGAVRV